MSDPSCRVMCRNHAGQISATRTPNGAGLRHCRPPGFGRRAKSFEGYRPAFYCVAKGNHFLQGYLPPTVVPKRLGRIWRMINNPASQNETVERLFTVLKSLNEFDKQEVRGLVRGLIARSGGKSASRATTIEPSPI